MTTSAQKPGFNAAADLSRALLRELNAASDSGPESCNQVRCVQLIRDGADIDAKDSAGLAPVHVAARYGLPLVLQALITRSVKIDASSESGRTALMYAAQNGHIESVRLLLESGADPSLKDDQGKSALELAHPAVTKDIKDYGYLWTKREELAAAGRVREEELRMKEISDAVHKGADVARESAPMPAIKKNPFPGKGGAT